MFNQSELEKIAGLGRIGKSIGRDVMEFKDNISPKKVNEIKDIINTNHLKGRRALAELDEAKRLHGKAIGQAIGVPAGLGVGIYADKALKKREEKKEALKVASFSPSEMEKIAISIGAIKMAVKGGSKLVGSLGDDAAKAALKAAKAAKKSKIAAKALKSAPNVALTMPSVIAELKPNKLKLGQ